MKEFKRMKFNIVMTVSDSKLQNCIPVFKTVPVYNLLPAFSLSLPLNAHYTYLLYLHFSSELFIEFKKYFRVPNKFQGWEMFHGVKAPEKGRGCDKLEVERLYSTHKEICSGALKLFKRKRRYRDQIWEI